MDIAKIVSDINNDGYSLVDSWFSLDELNRLRDLFEIIINDKSLNTEYSVGKTSRLLKEHENTPERLELRRLMRGDKTKSICDKFFKGDYKLNPDIFLALDVVGSKHIAHDLHFDIIPTLKFFVYLTDTDARNGALRIVPGSQNWTQRLRLEHPEKLSLKNRDISRHLPHLGDEVSIDGKAGDMIIFHTDVFHRTGDVSNGERKIIRGHSRLIETLETDFDVGGSLLSRVFKKFF